MKKYIGEYEWVQTVAVLGSLAWIGYLIFNFFRALLVFE